MWWPRPPTGSVCHGGPARVGLRRTVSPREIVRTWAADARELRGPVPSARRVGRAGHVAARMILLPAIDILEGKAVRLARGDFDQRTEYDADPLRAAQRWVAAGARALHVVDLDGARSGQPANLEHVRRIVTEVGVPVQVGGGLRNHDAVTTRSWRPAPPAWCWERRPSATWTSWTRPWPPTGIGSWSRSTPGEASWPPPGWTEQTEIPVDGRDRESGRPRRHPVRLLEHRA